MYLFNLQKDRKTERQNEIDHNNPLLSSIINKKIIYAELIKVIICFDSDVVNLYTFSLIFGCCFQSILKCYMF